MSSAMIMDPEEWAQAEFGECQLGDRRRNKRLVRYAMQAAARPDEGTPDQTESWAELKAVYRLFNAEEATFQKLLGPHCQRTRETGPPGDVKLIVNDTTEMNFTAHRATTGLGAVGGSGPQRGFHVHSGLMLDAATEVIDGLAGQELFHRPPPGKKRGAKNSRRRDPAREWAVWGRLIERIGRPPEGAKWLHVCDRAADDFEVMLRAIRQGCGFVIRASKLNRKVLASDGRPLPLDQLPREWSAQGMREISVKDETSRKPRVARLEIRFGEVLLPQPCVTTAWIREHASDAPLRLRVVELREVPSRRRAKPLRWLLYTTEDVCDAAAALRIVRYYELRWTIEDFHKCWKTGCALESRRYETADRLERVAAVTAVVAVRLLRMRTAAKETPDRPASAIALQRWIEMIVRVRKLRQTAATLTIREFIRALAALGGFLGRQHDGEPGWITLWRGWEELELLTAGFELGEKTSKRYG
jgi:hypothetical protein